MLLFVSFTLKRNDWFIFNEKGDTVQTGFKTRRAAERAAYVMMFPGSVHARPAA